MFALQWCWRKIIKPAQFNVSEDWHPIHSRGEYPLSRKECKPQMTNVATVKDHTWFIRRPIWVCGGFPTNGIISCSLLFVFSSHSCCHMDLTCAKTSGLRSECGIRLVHFCSLVSTLIFLGCRHDQQMDAIHICC